MSIPQEGENGSTGETGLQKPRQRFAAKIRGVLTRLREPIFGDFEKDLNDAVERFVISDPSFGYDYTTMYMDLQRTFDKDGQRQVRVTLHRKSDQRDLRTFLVLEDENGVLSALPEDFSNPVARLGGRRSIRRDE